MNDFQNLIMWAVMNREKINFKYKVHPQEDGIKVVSVSMMLDGKEMFGSGTSPDLNIALGKGIAECVERITMLAHNVQNSSGMAAHMDSMAAIKSSKQELYERDAFLFYFHWRIKPEIFIQEKHVTYFELKAAYPSVKVIMAIDSTNGFIVSLGSAGELESAYQKAREEMIAIKGYIEVEKPKPLSLTEFADVKTYLPISHLRMAMEPTFKQHLNGWPIQGKEYSERKIDHTFQSKILSLPNPFNESGIQVAHSTNETLLNYYLGSTEKLKNQKAFQIAEASAGKADLSLSHPFS